MFEFEPQHKCLDIHSMHIQTCIIQIDFSLTTFYLYFRCIWGRVHTEFNFQFQIEYKTFVKSRLFMQYKHVFNQKQSQQHINIKHFCFKFSVELKMKYYSISSYSFKTGFHNFFSWKCNYLCFFFFTFLFSFFYLKSLKICVKYFAIIYILTINQLSK